MRGRQKPPKETGRWVFMRYLWAHWTTTQQQICLFFSSPKGSPTKACEFCFIWPCGKHMSFHPACILPRRWTAVGAIESVPAHLSVLQCLQTKSLVRVLPFLGSVSAPPQPIVTSNMLLWCFRHIFLMFYTPYNLLCVAKAILLADIIDGARDPARVNLAEKASASFTTETARTHSHTHRQIHTYALWVKLGICWYLKFEVSCFVVETSR